MTEPKIYIPKSIAFQRSAKLASSASRQIDNGVPPNEAHVVALLEYFEFLAPEQFTSMMGPGLGAEFSAVTEHEFPLGLLKERAPLLQLLLDHTSMFAGAFCRDGEDDPRCYREWKRVRQESLPSGRFNGYACLASNITMAMTLGQSPPFADSKVQLLKHRILRRTAEILLASGYESEEHLRQILPAQGPDSAQLLAMQVFVLSRRGPDDLLKLCGKINGSSEATLVYWASKDPLIRYLLKTWQWLEPIGYDGESNLSREVLKERGGMLYTTWKGGLGAPAGLAQRELPGSGAEREDRFPCVLGAGQRQRFSPVPLLLIGGPGVGKTAFLRALAWHLDQAGGTLGKGLHLEPAEPHGFWNSTGELWEPSTHAIGAQPRGYHIRVRDDQDPQVARWMRLTLMDHDREDLTRLELRPDFLKRLRAAKALLFFVDDRHFPDRVSKDLKGASHPMEEWPKDAVGLAAWYTRILQAFYDLNSDAMHLPVALVVSKADLLLGGPHLPPPDPAFLITEEVKMELVHAGLKYSGEPDDPFGRLRYCIRNTLSNSKDMNQQAFIFELLERFRGFIAVALGQTYRFQIFLTSSLTPNAENREQLPYGIWEVARWIVNQLEPAYRVQATHQLEQDRAELEQLKKDIEEALVRDKEAYADFEAACKQKEKRLNAKMHVAMLDNVLRRDPDATDKRIDSSKQRMRTALEEAFSSAELGPVTDAVDPVPFTTRRRMVQQALGRLEEQIAYLTEWREHLSPIKLQPAVFPAQSKKAAMNYIRNTMHKRWAS
jgi:hypothetical protein